jgi:DNA-binding NarL/FixJ family response regulator
MEACIDIVVAEPDPIARRAVRDALDGQQGLDIVGEAVSVHAVEQLVAERQPHILLTERWLSERSPPPLPRLRELCPLLRVVFFCSSLDPEVELELLSAGAVGCLSKDLPLEVLPLVLRGVADGQAGVSRAATMRLLERLHGAANGAGLRPIRSTLTSREWEVLDLILQGLDGEAVAERLVIAQATVATHTKALHRKLGVRSRAALIKAAKELR